MGIQERLIEHCSTYHITAVIEDGSMEFEEKLFYIVPEDQLLFDKEFKFILTNSEHSNLQDEFDGFVYLFGGRWYLQYSHQDLDMVELRNIGKPKISLPNKSFLGVHSAYEIMNGLSDTKMWVKKAKFLGVKNLGFCEKNTLASVLVFQKECKKAGIKSVAGMTLTVDRDGFLYDLKFYIKNYTGWNNALKMSTLLNVDQKTAVPEDFLEEHLEGLFIVLDPKELDYEEIPLFGEYYQLDPVNYLLEDRDAKYLDNLEKYITDGTLSPVSITDAFYIEKDEYLVRELMWIIGKKFDFKTDNQFFKTKDEYAVELRELFEKGNRSWIELYKEAVANEDFIAESCNFVYDMDTRHLPKYTMTSEEKGLYGTNEKMFFELIKKGFKDRKVKDPEKYLTRLKEEIRVLQKGDVLDYFLSLHDIVKHAKEQGILTGIGRGSAGGSLVSYLLNIIQIDPMDFDLLFERFLNDGRMGHFEDRPSYKIQTDEGEIELAEGSVLKVERNGELVITLVDALQEGDKILKYE